MGFFDIFKKKTLTNDVIASTQNSLNSPEYYADSSSIAPDERPYYQPDNYYTYFSYPGTAMAVRVVPFDERKRSTYPSARGLFVAEIMLLEYCSHGKYPKPNGGYPGFWWFKYGIRDIGHALESLQNRGFIKLADKIETLKGLNLDDLKQILANAGLSTSGKKTELISRIESEIPEDKIFIPNYTPKYELTDIGKMELEENGYVPYMHRHSRLTTEEAGFGETFTVWDINKRFPNGNARDWRNVVGKIEKERFGIDMANARPKDGSKNHINRSSCITQREEIRSYLETQKIEISKGIKTTGDGFEEETQGMVMKSSGRDKEALVKFYIAIGKRFDAPALYREAAILLRKYGMYEEELSVIEAGLQNVQKNNTHWNKLFERKKKVQELIKKKKDKTS